MNPLHEVEDHRFIGLSIDEAKVICAKENLRHRVLYPNSIYTMDLDNTRLNLYPDAHGKIEKVKRF